MFRTPGKDITAKSVEPDKIQRKSKSRKSKKRKVRKSKKPSQDQMNITSTDVVDIEIPTSSAQVLDINQADTIQNKDDLKETKLVQELLVVDQNIQEPVAEINHLDHPDLDQNALKEDDHTKPPFDKAPATDIEKSTICPHILRTD